MIKKYGTEIDNFYMFVSHGQDGKSRVSYGLVSDNNLKMVEIIPKYGPITILNSELNIIDDYINHRAVRCDWTQSGYDENNINGLLDESNFEGIVEILKRYF